MDLEPATSKSIFSELDFEKMRLNAGMWRFRRAIDLFLASAGLASSKSGTSRDDRAVFYLSLIESLSVYQIRTHYILYSSILWIGDDEFAKIHTHLANSNLTVTLMEDDYVSAMEFGQGERPFEIIPHCFTGLETKGLMKGGRAYSPNQHIPSMKGLVGPRRYFYVTELGIQLFLWGIGQGHLTAIEFTPELLGKLDQTFEVKACHMDLGHVGY